VARCLRYVDDGLATSVLPTMAALEVFENEPVAFIAGGYDRGVDYEETGQRPGRSIPAHDRHHDGRRRTAPRRGAARHRAELSRHAATMLEAVQLARTSLDTGGVVLLSPAAPSFDAYRNWEERSDDFTSIVSLARRLERPAVAQCRAITRSPRRRDIVKSLESSSALATGTS